MSLTHDGKGRTEVTSAGLLADAFGRIRDTVHLAVGGLTPEELTFRLDSEANSIAWLVWHLTRIQDDHISDVAGTDQVWTAWGWAQRFGLPLDVSDTGYGHGPHQVAVVTSDAESLRDYHDAGYEMTLRFVGAGDRCRCRSRSHRGRAVGAARHLGRSTRERHRRRPAARRTGRLRPRDSRAPMTPVPTELPG
jgi:Protein of unknown function (DUF664)